MYKIKLNQFEGPLDLLLFFIKRDELNIYDIPISKITSEFMSYLHMMKQLDLEVAGEFLLMAATLMQIKVRMLLPKEVNDKGEEIDPRTDLVNALLEYKRYKEMADEFAYMEANQRKIYSRSYFKADKKEKVENVEKLLKNITIYDLLKAFKNVLIDKQAEPVHEIEKFNVTIDEQIDFILGRVAKSQYVHFLDLVAGMREKLRIIVTFIALLELIKLGAVGIEETQNFNDFMIYRISDGEDIQFGY
jgi:segregation and condensation protein A